MYPYLFVASHLFTGQRPMSRDGFKERGALDHLSFSSPTQVWPI